MKKQDIADEDGNTLVIEPDSDVGRLTTLLEYARARGFRLGPYVKVGEITCQVQDLRQDAARARDSVVTEPDIYEQHGFDPSGG